MSKNRYNTLAEYEADSGLLDAFPEDSKLLKAIQRRVNNSEQHIVELIRDSLEDKFFQKDDLDGLFTLMTLSKIDKVPVVKSESDYWFEC